MILLYISEWRLKRSNRPDAVKTKAVVRHLSYATRLPLQDALTKLLQHRHAHELVYPDTDIEYRLLTVSNIPDDLKGLTLRSLGVKLIEKLPTTVAAFKATAVEVANTQ